MTVSAQTGTGIHELWDCIVEHRRRLESTGALARRRAQGRLAWMQVLLERRLLERFESQTGLPERRAELEQAVQQGQITPEAAVEQLFGPPSKEHQLTRREGAEHPELGTYRMGASRLYGLVGSVP